MLDKSKIESDEINNKLNDTKRKREDISNDKIESNTIKPLGLHTDSNGNGHENTTDLIE